MLSELLVLIKRWGVANPCVLWFSRGEQKVKQPDEYQVLAQEDEHQ